MLLHPDLPDSERASQSDFSHNPSNYSRAEGAFTKKIRIIMHTGELIIKPPHDKSPTVIFWRLFENNKTPSTFSREAREIFWAFWAFNGDFLTKFGKF